MNPGADEWADGFGIVIHDFFSQIISIGAVTAPSQTRHRAGLNDAEAAIGILPDELVEEPIKTA